MLSSLIEDTNITRRVLDDNLCKVKIILTAILLWLCVSVLANKDYETAGQRGDAECPCNDGIYSNKPGKDYTYYCGSIVGEQCNTHFKIDGNFNYRYSAISCGHGVEACEYQTLNDGYYFVSCSQDFDVAHFKADTAFVFNNTMISIGDVDKEVRVMRTWESKFYVVHCFIDKSKKNKYLEVIKNIIVE